MTDSNERLLAAVARHREREGDEYQSSTERLERLEANARYATDRYRLYRARVSGPTATSAGRLRELQREAELAQRTLARAQEAHVAI
jgi:hypothetical protein